MGLVSCLRKNLKKYPQLAESLGAANAFAYVKAQCIDSLPRLFPGNEPRLLYSKHASYPVSYRPRTSDKDVFDQIFVQREYSCLDEVTDADLILDCGANIGCSSAYFLAKFPRAYLIAIEPDPGNFAMLESNLKPYGERVRLVRSGVWSHPANLVLVKQKFGDGRDWATQVRECGPGESPDMVAVDITTLLETSGYGSVSILKMDVERAEAEIFSRNYEKWIHRVAAIVIELHDEECSNIFQKAIASLGFQVSQSGELTVCRKKHMQGFKPGSSVSAVNVCDT
jgi:FkbM family methyltransferase